MKTFQVKKVTIPEHVIRIELSMEEFKRLVEKQDFTPLFENDKIVFSIMDEPATIFFAEKKEAEKK